MPEAATCADCGSPIPPNAPEGYCSKCLLGLALTTGTKEIEMAPASNSTPDGIELFGDYELLGKLGEGGMGVVYRARQQKLGRTVALKMMRSGALASPEEIKRFQSEARAAARLQHPHVVAIHEIGEANGRLFFSMEYIEGASLAQLIRASPLTPERAARYLKTIAEAVHYAHQRGILHRDLTPANVLIDAQHDQPRITDFGLAKHTEVDSGITISGAVFGTPGYMPPEQAAGKPKEISPASDVYSLGAILYDCLTGRPPFRAHTPVETLRQVLDTEPAAPRLLNPKVPRDLETICLKCLAKDLAQRYNTAQELAEELGRFLVQQPIQARPLGRAVRMWRWCRRHPGPAGFSGIVGAMVLLLAIAAIIFRHDLSGLTAFAAQQTAVRLSNEMANLAAVVAGLAQDGRLAALIESGDTDSLERLLEGHHDAVDQSPLRWIGDRPFESWSIFDRQGVLLARWPPIEVELKSRNFQDRDHFHGALGNGARPHSAVEGTPFIVLVQTRDRVTDALATAGLAALSGLLLFLLWRFLKHRRVPAGPG